MSVLIEVIAQSVADAIEAEAGGADRLELVRDLDQDGLTPPPGLVRAVREAVRIPVFVMVRPKNCFQLSAEERELFAREVREVVTAGADGIVFGYVDTAGGLDEEAIQVVRDATGSGVGLTFHRAFDRLTDPQGAMPILARFGVQRVLTSGGAPIASQGVPALRSSVSAAVRCGVTVMAGGGLTPENAADLVRETGVDEVHFGAGVREPPSPTSPVSRRRVSTARHELR